MSSSRVLILGSNSIHSLVPSSLITQVEALLEAHKLEDAFKLVDARRKRMEESIDVDEDQAEELRYVYQRLGFKYLSETMFEEAGSNLFNGQLDPRVIVSYFPDLRGDLFSDEDHVDVYAGIAELMPREASVDDIIIFNLVRNYSPHMSPNTRTAPPTAELRKILQERALLMLESFLKKERRRRMALDLDKELETMSSKGKEKERPRPVRAVIDTVLAKIYAQSGKTSELFDLIPSPNFIVLSEMDSVLREARQYNALSILYQLNGEENDEKLVELWAKVVEGEWDAPDIPDPLLQMVSLLTEKRDRALTQKWAIWLLKRDQEAAISLLTTLRGTGGGGKRRERERTASGEDIALLQQIEMESSEAAKQYLEHLVLQKCSQSKDLHDRLALTCIDEVLEHLRSDEAVSKLWRAKVSSYSTSRSSRPAFAATSRARSIPQPTQPTPSFFAYFESTTPESASKRARLRCILFLCGSHLYNPSLIKERILEEKREKVLSLEMALLEGKLGNHRAALRTLACDLNDATSAEAYCTLQGEFIPAKVALSIAETASLEKWVECLFLGNAPGRGGKDGAHARKKPGGGKEALLLIQRPVNEAKRKELLKVLLEVYTDDDSPTSAERASQLLSAQAINLDVLDVLELVPPTWSLPSLEPFLARSFRRLTHARRETQIAKSISSGENLKVKEMTYEPLRLAGAVVEELVESDSDSDSNELGQKEYDEKKVGVVEKVVAVESTGPGPLSEKGGDWHLGVDLRDDQLDLQ